MSSTHETETNHELPISERFSQYVLNHTKKISDGDTWAIENWSGESRLAAYDIQSSEGLIPIDAMELIVYTLDEEQGIDYNLYSISLSFNDQALYSITYLDYINKKGEEGFLLDLAGFGDTGFDEKNEILADKLITELIGLEVRGLVVPKTTT
jgi:hypothetical protein